MHYRGFFRATMLEIAPGVYVSPRMSKAVRERVWDVIREWHGTLRSGAIVMLWRDKTKPGHIAIETLGEPSEGDVRSRRTSSWPPRCKNRFEHCLKFGIFRSSRLFDNVNDAVVTW